MARVCGNCKSSDIKNVNAVLRGTSAPALIKLIKSIKPNEGSRASWFIGSIAAVGITGWMVYFTIKEKGFLSIFTGYMEDGTALFFFIPSLLLFLFCLRKYMALDKDKKQYESTWYCFSCGQLRIFKG